MTFTVETLHGYETGKQYEKSLKYVRMFGNARRRHVVLRDEEGVELLWNTSDNSNTYQNFKMRAVYKFKVEYIVNPKSAGSIPLINITRMVFSK